jgi:predicted aminopeptidase
MPDDQVELSGKSHWLNGWHNRLMINVAGIALNMCGVILLLSGCSEMRYYQQSAGGQLDILDRRVPIEELVEDEAQDPQLRARLQRVAQFRAFAIEQLKLPETGSYTAYADLERDYVVKSLFAAPEFSVELHQWCYPILGCAAYRGYFDTELLAKDNELFRAQGFDTYIALIPAYSTLGWFDDPVLNTVIGWPDPQLAGLVFHELAHQKLYVEGDTVFNESFATAVEQAGVELWLAEQGNTGLLSQYQVRRARQRKVVELIEQIRSELDELYRQDMNRNTMRHAKQQQLDMSQKRYRVLRGKWEDDPGYDNWFAGELNNAKLGSVSAYHACVDEFLALLGEEEYNFDEFYKRAATIGALDLPARRERMTCLSINQAAMRLIKLGE